MAQKKILYSAFLVFLFVFNFWSVPATPCGSWNVDRSRTHDIILTRPLEEEIILVMFSEDGGDGNENSVQSDNISTQNGIDDRLSSGEVVDSAANKEEITPITKTDPLPSNETQKVQHEKTSYNTTEAIIEDVGITTESVLVKVE